MNHLKSVRPQLNAVEEDFFGEEADQVFAEYCIIAQSIAKITRVTVNNKISKKLLLQNFFVRENILYDENNKYAGYPNLWIQITSKTYLLFYPFRGQGELDGKILWILSYGPAIYQSDWSDKMAQFAETHDIGLIPHILVDEIGWLSKKGTEVSTSKHKQIGNTFLTHQVQIIHKLTASGLYVEIFCKKKDMIGFSKLQNEYPNNIRIITEKKVNVTKIMINSLLEIFCVELGDEILWNVCMHTKPRSYYLIDTGTLVTKIPEFRDIIIEMMLSNLKIN